MSHNLKCYLRLHVRRYGYVPVFLFCRQCFHKVSINVFRVLISLRESLTPFKKDLKMFYFITILNYKIQLTTFWLKMFWLNTFISNALDCGGGVLILAACEFDCLEVRDSIQQPQRPTSARPWKTVDPPEGGENFRTFGERHTLY